MITSAKQAVAVQTRRHKAGKRGFSKAVRRYMKRSDGFALREQLPHTFIRPTKNTNPET